MILIMMLIKIMVIMMIMILIMVDQVVIIVSSPHNLILMLNADHGDVGGEYSPLIPQPEHNHSDDDADDEETLLLGSCTHFFCFAQSSICLAS